MLRFAWAIGLVAQQAGAQITVVDDFARTVTLSAPAERILSLSPHITENLFSAGLGDKIVGVGKYSDYPPQALQIPSVGSSHALINIEAVISLAPDLVVAWQTAGNRESLKKIEALGYPIYYSEPDSFESIIENIEELAQLADSVARINPSPTKLRAELAKVRATFSDKKMLSVFYQVWGSPLITLNRTHLISRALELCGAHNIFAHLPIVAPHISIESVLEANPDIIISGKVRGEPPDMSMWDQWNSLTAVQHNSFLFADSAAMHRQTARMIMSIFDLCEQIDQVRSAITLE